MRLPLTALVSAALVLAACGDDGADAVDTAPAAVIGAYYEAYNAGDIDAVMALFTEDSVVTGHPFSSESRGVAEIRAVQLDDIDAAAAANAYTFSIVGTTGDTVTWDHQWVRSDGEQRCVSGHTAVVEDGAILSWEWPTGDADCP